MTRCWDNASIITIDVDWAPDFIISEIAEILIRNRTKATWFITHDSEAIRTLFDIPNLFEVGLHPNFMSNSTQGSTPKEVMRYLKNIAPDAVSVRMHALVQSTILLRTLTEEFGMRNDVSLLLPRAACLVPHRLYFAENSYLVRLPYFWEDDVEALHFASSYLLEDEFHHASGLKIYNFHPFHIVTNMSSPTSYELFKTYSSIPLCTPSDIEHLRNERCGTGTLFRDLIQHISGGYTIGDVAREWDKEG